MEELRSVKIDCGVAYHEDLHCVKETVRTLLGDVFNMREATPLQFVFVGLSEMSINFQVRFSVRTRTILEFFELKKECITRLELAFLKKNRKVDVPARSMEFASDIGRQVQCCN